MRLGAAVAVVAPAVKPVGVNPPAPVVTPPAPTRPPLAADGAAVATALDGTKLKKPSATGAGAGAGTGANAATPRAVVAVVAGRAGLSAGAAVASALFPVATPPVVPVSEVVGTKPLVCPPVMAPPVARLLLVGGASALDVVFYLTRIPFQLILNSPFSNKHIPLLTSFSIGY